MNEQLQEYLKVKHPLHLSLREILGLESALNLAKTQVRCVLEVMNNPSMRTIDCRALPTATLETWLDTADNLESLLHCYEAAGVAVRGHEAAREWYIDFNNRIEEADGYEVPSRLREAFEALPLDQQGPFVEAIGALYVTERIVGEPYADKYDFAESIEFQAMPATEQDAWAHRQALMQASQEVGHE